MKNALTIMLLVTTLMAAFGCHKPGDSNKLADVDYYTCTMHPSVHRDAPGKCPICGMELVPVKKKDAAQASPQGGSPGANKPSEFIVPVERQQQIGVTYAAAERTPLRHSIRAVGMVEADLQRR